MKARSKEEIGLNRNDPRSEPLRARLLTGDVRELLGRGEAITNPTNTNLLCFLKDSIALFQHSDTLPQIGDVQYVNNNNCYWLLL
jgi:hypothetical protein